jgi:hypothetical protein
MDERNSNEVGSTVAQIERDAALRFARWDADLWQQVLAGPGRELSEGLLRSGTSTADAARVVEAWLRLVSQGIGLGYLVPPSLGAANFFTVAFTELVPRMLPRMPPERQAEALAQCWNLGENLESAPAWLRPLFLRASRELGHLGDLTALVERVGREAFEPPPVKLDDRFRLVWVHLGRDDARFLPGAVHFVAPMVACVHDRHRSPAAGSPGVSVGVWLRHDPEVLGPMGCEEAPPCPGPAVRDPVVQRIERADRRVTTLFAAARNEWRAAVTLVTSQQLVVALPEGPP